MLLNLADISVSEAINGILDTRGIVDKERFLCPLIDDLLPYDALPNLDTACEIIKDGIKKNKKFVVHFDVDTDGVMSGTIMTRYLRDLNCDVEYFINEGKRHGTTDELIEFCKDADIVIIVDSLDSKIDNYKKLKEMGKQIIVLDHHHIGNAPYDDYVVLVSSYDTENDQLSGGGVVYKFVNYLDDALGVDYSSKYADLCCCALLGDMMNVGEDYMENRFLVMDGLDHLYNKTLKKLVGGFGFNSRAVAFSVAPKINACQRLRMNKLAVEAFLTDDDDIIKNCIKEFNSLKDKQNLLVDQIMEACKESVEAQLNDKLIFVKIEADSELTGLVGNKLLGLYHRPVLVLKENKDSYSGSGRSIGTKDFRFICEQSGYGKFLGHPNSFGILDIKKDDLDSLKKYLKDYLSNYQYSMEEKYDAEIEAADISEDLVNEVQKVDRISGRGFESLQFKVMISDYVVGEMGKGKHIYLSPKDREDVRIIIWNVSEDMKEFILDCELMECNLYCIGTLQAGWFGRKFYLQVITDEMKLL